MPLYENYASLDFWLYFQNPSFSKILLIPLYREWTDKGLAPKEVSKDCLKLVMGFPQIPLAILNHPQNLKLKYTSMLCALWGEGSGCVPAVGGSSSEAPSVDVDSAGFIPTLLSNVPTWALLNVAVFRLLFHGSWIESRFIQGDILLYILVWSKFG